MALNVVSEIKVSCPKKIVSPQLRRLLCNALIQIIPIMHAQFVIPTLTKKSKLSYELFKTNVYVSAFN